MENDDSGEGAPASVPRPVAGASSVVLHQAAIERLPSHEAFEEKAGQEDTARAPRRCVHSSSTVRPGRWPPHSNPDWNRSSGCRGLPNPTASLRASTLKWRCSHAVRVGSGILKITGSGSWPCAVGTVSCTGLDECPSPLAGKSQAGKSQSPSVEHRGKSVWSG